jgi:hypothetical protein
MKSLITNLSQHQAVKYLRILYPIWAVVGLFGVMYARTSLIVSGDAGATANNLVAQEMLFRAGIVGSLITQLIHIAVVLILYKLFKSVNKDHAVLLVVLGLVGVPISMLNTLNRVAALMLASGADYLGVFTTDQLHALNLNEQGMYIATIFWGLWLFPLGYLIKKSGYFPKIIGNLVMIGGIGYTSEPFIRYILPETAATIVPIVLILTMGEIVFMGWITLKGAKLPATKS